MTRWTAVAVIAVMTATCAGLPAVSDVPSALAGAQRSVLAAGSGGTWGTAEEVPGTAALNTGGQAGVEAVSCTSTGTCGGGGYYSTASGASEGFVVSQANGTWGTAREMGSNLSYPDVDQMSCASAGNCSAAGGFLAEVNDTEVFVASETNGSWGKAKLLPGIAALNGMGYARVNGESCPAAGNCSVVGSAIPSSGPPDGYVADQKGGVWSKAQDVPGLAEMTSGGNGAGVFSVSCPSVGNCSAGGNYVDKAGHEQAFVVSRSNGTWGTALEVPGSAALNQGGYGGIDSVSCASAGNCVAGGYYTNGQHHEQALVVREKNGSWGEAGKLPGFATLNVSAGQINSLSCASAGSCAAGGYYTNRSGHEQAFLDSSTSGVWGTAEELPGTAALNAGGQAQISSVSCGAAGSCAAGGYYTDSSDHEQAFVDNSTSGVWGTAEEVPGMASLNAGERAQISSVSCGAAGSCAAGGYYTDGSFNVQAFVVDETG